MAFNLASVTVDGCRLLLNNANGDPIFSFDLGTTVAIQLFCDEIQIKDQNGSSTRVTNADLLAAGHSITTIHALANACASGGGGGTATPDLLEDGFTGLVSVEQAIGGIGTGNKIFVDVVYDADTGTKTYLLANSNTAVIPNVDFIPNATASGGGGISVFEVYRLADAKKINVQALFDGTVTTYSDLDSGAAITAAQLQTLYTSDYKLFDENVNEILSGTTKTYAADTYGSISFLVTSGSVDITYVNDAGTTETVTRLAGYSQSFRGEGKPLSNPITIDATAGTCSVGIFK